MCFSAGLERRGGVGAAEVRTGIQQIRAFLEAHGNSRFEALGIELVEGRGIEAADRDGAVRVVVVNEALARAMWPGESALGRRVGATRWGGMFEVVGVIRDVAVHDLISEVPMAGYYAWQQVQTEVDSGVLVIETSLDPTSLASAVR